MGKKQRIIWVNAGVAGGLLYSYLRGAPVWIVAISGAFLFAVGNLAIWDKCRKSLRAPANSN
jgi:hypothetical protein